MRHRGLFCSTRGFLLSSRGALLGLSALAVLSCAPDRLNGLSDDDPGDGSGGMMPGGPMQSCKLDVDCGTGRRCVDNRCIPDGGTCRPQPNGDDECLADAYCACPPEVKSSGCVCIPWGSKPRGSHDDMCSGEAFAPGDFKNPVLKCQWPPGGANNGYANVISTPLVIDLDRDGQAEIVFATGYPGQTHLVAMSGADCSVKFDKVTDISGCTHIAAGDLDGDGKPEIVALAPGVAVFDYQGNLKASISTPSTGACTQDYPPAIANLDGAGPPEIITGAQVSRYTGGATPKIDVLWNQTAAGGTWGIIALAEDLDADGKLEVITGNRVFDGITGADKTKTTLRGVPSGYPAIGDFNGDGHPDIVLVSSQSNNQKVSIIDYWNDRFLMPLTGAANGWGGAPTVADFDGDGRPEFATASANFYYVYSPDCLASPRPAKCTGSDPGVLWQSRTQDSSSGSTGSSVFDFNGDKVAEVVYRDECWLRVYSGPDGKKLFAAPVSSGTDLEMPVIADTDGDGHADIVVPSDSVQGDNCRGPISATELGMPHGPPTQGIKVYKDPMDRWMPSRSIWNQHSYHITNVGDDGSIPTVEASNFLTYNNYRQNVQGAVAGTRTPLGDATGKIGIAPDAGDCIKVYRPSGSICNRGTASLPAGMPSTFYLGDPRKPGAMKICTARTMTEVKVGTCQTVFCEWMDPTLGPYDLWLRVNDDGASRPYGQCKTGNDLAHMPNAGCSRPPG